MSSLWCALCRIPRGVMRNFLVMLAVVSAGPAHADDGGSLTRKLVTRSKEIVVSYPPDRDSASTIQHVITHLRLPTYLRLREVTLAKGIAIVSPVTSDGVSASPVEVDEVDVNRACADILEHNRGIPLHCEANIFRKITKTPNDPLLSHLYGLTQMKAPEAWDISTGSAAAIVAIVDTGVHYNHPDLAANIALNTREIVGNGVDDDANGYVDDYFGYDFFGGDTDPFDENGHGTHCAGIVAARGDNQLGSVGVTWGASILPVRVLGPSGGGLDSDVAAGIQYAVQRGAAVLSLSLGGSSPSQVIDSAIDLARSAGVLVVAAAGNEGQNNDVYPSYPANSALDNVISVAATDSNDRLADFSNFGVRSVDIAAPGKSILSTYLADSFVLMSGTSMATPHIAGVAALMKSINPALTYADLKAGLFQSADNLPSLEKKVATGGRINAYKAAFLAASVAPPWVTPAPVPVAEPAVSDQTLTISLNSKRYGRTAVLFGYLKDFDRVAVAKRYLYLNCETIRARRVKSDRDGYYAFKVTRPRRSEKCYVYDANSNRSRSITVR